MQVNRWLGRARRASKAAASVEPAIEALTELAREAKQALSALIVNLRATQEVNERLTRVETSLGRLEAQGKTPQDVPRGSENNTVESPAERGVKEV